MLMLSQLADDLPRKIIPWSDDFKVSRSGYTLFVHVGYVSSSADSTRNYNIFSIGGRGRNVASSTDSVHKSVFKFSHDMPHKEPTILVSWTHLQCKSLEPWESVSPCRNGDSSNLSSSQSDQRLRYWRLLRTITIDQVLSLTAPCRGNCSPIVFSYQLPMTVTDWIPGFHNIDSGAGLIIGTPRKSAK